MGVDPELRIFLRRIERKRTVKPSIEAGIPAARQGDIEMQYRWRHAWPGDADKLAAIFRELPVIFPCGSIASTA